MQIHGPTMENLSNTRRQLEIEMNSSTDNPLVFEDGNFKRFSLYQFRIPSYFVFMLLEKNV